jgi:hypothetical protein
MPDDKCGKQFRDYPMFCQLPPKHADKHEGQMSADDAAKVGDTAETKYRYGDSHVLLNKNKLEKV